MSESHGQPECVDEHEIAMMRARMNGYIFPNTAVTGAERDALDAACRYQIEHERRQREMLEGEWLPDGTTEFTIGHFQMTFAGGRDLLPPHAQNHLRRGVRHSPARGPFVSRCGEGAGRMSLISAFLNEEATVRPFVRYGGGAVVYGEPYAIRCRMEPAPKSKVVYKNPDGSIVETVASALMFAQGEEIPVGSEVRCGDRSMRVIQCGVMRGFGAHHMEVLLE